MMKNEFLNPYNFVKLPESKRTKYNDNDKHTGVIEYSITTKTPLFIPNTSSETAFKQSDVCVDTKDIHKSYDFYSYTMLEADKRYENEYHSPVIPGSEVRGMVRSIYETLTASCMSGLTEDETPVKRVEGTFKPGLIAKDKDSYAIFEAESIRTDFDDKKTIDGQKVFVKKHYKNKKVQDITKYSNRYAKDSDKTGYVLNWGDGGTKKGKHIFIQKSQNKICNIDKSIVEDLLLKVIKSYKEQSNVTPDNKQAYEDYEKALKVFISGKSDSKNNIKAETYFPVNYLILDNSSNIVYLSPASISKEAYKNSIGKLAGDFAPCKDDDNICPACALFGRIGEKHTNSIASKIRFADAYPIDKNNDLSFYYQDNITLQTLSNPKLSNIAFYLERPENSNFWTYDYYIDKDDLENIIVEPAKLKGRKYYWHNKQCLLPKQVEITKFNKTIRPLKRDVTFKGKIYFEDISKKQLKELIWIINGGNSDSQGNVDICYKLGTGKPLGLGSVKCNVNKVLERVLNINGDNIEYNEVEITSEYKNESYDDIGFCQSSKVEFLNLCNFNAVPEDLMITYPRQYDQMEDEILDKGYMWYEANKSTIKSKHNEMYIKQNLSTAEKVTPLKCNSSNKESNNK